MYLHELCKPSAILLWRLVFRECIGEQEADLESNLATTQEAVSAVDHGREYLIWRDRRCTYAQLTERSRRVACYLCERGLARTFNAIDSRAMSPVKVASCSTCAIAVSSSKRFWARSNRGQCR